MFNACVQVVEIKLQVELAEKRKKALRLQKASRRGMVLVKPSPSRTVFCPSPELVAPSGTVASQEAACSALRGLVAPGDRLALGQLLWPHVPVLLRFAGWVRTPG